MKHLKILFLLLICSCASQTYTPKQYSIGGENYPLVVEKVKWDNCQQQYKYYMTNLEFPVWLPDSFGVGSKLYLKMK